MRCRLMKHLNFGNYLEKKMKENVANKSFSREGESGLKLKFPFS